ncbi:hypothetical protein K3495_g11767 [Podosphaera aphanis]|nr:hypothetical protein K3495_g11767 [Podosphaera aphanis]
MVKNPPNHLRSKAIFLAYINALNSHIRHTSLDLSPFMHPKLIVNNAPFTLLEYENSLASLIDAARDFHIEVKFLVVEGTSVATRFLLSCTPESQFMGYPPNENRVEFAEHVFYRFEGDKCCEINALKDIDTLRRQLGVHQAYTD